MKTLKIMVLESKIFTETYVKYKEVSRTKFYQRIKKIHVKVF
jgi:hypothetical protein